MRGVLPVEKKRMLWLIGSLCLVLILAVLPFTACPQPAETITLKFNDWGPPGIGIGELHTQAADMIKERTNGRVEVECYFSESLLKYGDTFAGVSEGVADITLYVIGATAGVHVLNEVFGLPFIGDIPGMRAGAEIYTELLNEYPVLDEENQNLNTTWISIRVMPPSQMHLVKKQVTTPEDIRGMKIITGTGAFTDMMNAEGASCILLGPPDWYTSLERGLAEAQVTHWAAVSDFKLTELFKYHTHFGGGGAGLVPIGFLANLDSWNKLTAEEREIITEVYDWVNEESLTYDIDLVERAVAEAKDMGHTVTELTPEQIAVWAAAAQPHVEKWLDDTEAEGWPAREVYNALKQKIAEY
jgi:TRAP-type C4-dicarboxylate transport system substrate-binding protein